MDRKAFDGWVSHPWLSCFCDWRRPTTPVAILHEKNPAPAGSQDPTEHFPSSSSSSFGHLPAQRTIGIELLAGKAVRPPLQARGLRSARAAFATRPRARKGLAAESDLAPGTRLGRKDIARASTLPPSARKYYSQHSRCIRGQSRD